MQEEEKGYKKAKVYLDPDSHSVKKEEDVDEGLIYIFDYAWEVIKIIVAHYILKLIGG
jgi:hypothetical protein